MHLNQSAYTESKEIKDLQKEFSSEKDILKKDITPVLKKCKKKEITP